MKFENFDFVSFLSALKHILDTLGVRVILDLYKNPKGSQSYVQKP